MLNAPDVNQSGRRLNLPTVPSRLAEILSRYAVEFTGSALLASVAICAVILPERWEPSEGVPAATVAGWVALAMLALTPAYVIGKGAFNPILTLSDMLRGDLAPERGLPIVGTQIAGAFAGVIGAQFMLNLDAVQASSTASLSPAAVFHEGAHAAVLVAGWLVLTPTRFGRAAFAGFAVLSAYVSLAYGDGFPFGNPALAIARTLTATALAMTPLQAVVAVAASAVSAMVAFLIVTAFTGRAPRNTPDRLS